jgi:hypothetical protein
LRKYSSKCLVSSEAFMTRCLDFLSLWHCEHSFRVVCQEILQVFSRNRKHHRPNFQVRSSRVRAENCGCPPRADLLASRCALPKKHGSCVWTHSVSSVTPCTAPWPLCQKMARPRATSGLGSNFLARCMYCTRISARKPPEGGSNFQKSPEKRMLIPPGRHLSEYAWL